MNLSCRDNISLRNVFLLVFCCALAACNNAGNRDPGKNETDLMSLTKRKYTIDKGRRVLPYLDSLYRAQKDKTPYIEAGRYLALATYYYDNALSNNAIPYVDSAIAIVDKQDLTGLAWKNYYFSAHVLKGSIYFGKGNYPLAIDGFFKAKELADKTENTCRINDDINNSIGLVLYRQKKYEDAKNYFKAAYELMKTCPLDRYKASGEQQLLDNVALCFGKEDKRDSALAWYHKALRLTETDSDKFNEDPAVNQVAKEICRGIIWGNIAQILVKQNKLDSAELLFKRNIFINSVLHKTEIGDAQLSQMHLADLYNSEEQYPKMKQALDGLRKSLDTLHNEDAELGWRRLIVEYDLKNKLRPPEFEHYTSYMKYKDSLDNAKRASYESDIADELKTRGQQLQISLLQKDNQLSRIYIWITVALSAAALGILALIYYYYRRGKKNIRTLTLLNREVGEQKDKLEFAMGELQKSNTDKERILKVVAHDMRNPISAISGLASSVMEEDIWPEKELQSLKLIKSTSVNSLTLINELLELELDRDQIALDKEPADINETVKQCIVLMQLIADKKNQKVHMVALAKPLILNIDRDRVERMINNLLSNAIKFSPAGEKIVVELEQKDKVVLISVKDKGIGIPPDVQMDLFTTFGSQRRKGTAGEKSFGLGLSICKQIIEAHNGKIWMESVAGSGSVFYVELPLV